MKEVNAQELKQMIDSKEDFQLIDVREPWEVEETSIGGLNIPLATVLTRADEISKDKKTKIPPIRLATTHKVTKNTLIFTAPPHRPLMT